MTHLLVAVLPRVTVSKVPTRPRSQPFQELKLELALCDINEHISGAKSFQWTEAEKSRENVLKVTDK